MCSVIVVFMSDSLWAPKPPVACVNVPRAFRKRKRYQLDGLSWWAGSLAIAADRCQFLALSFNAAIAPTPGPIKGVSRSQLARA